MALKYGFFNSVNNDRLYTAEDMTYPYKGIVSNGVIASNTKSDGFQVKGNNTMTVSITKGFGMFDGKWAELDSDMSLTVPTAHVTLTRIDSVVVKVDNSARTVAIVYNNGTPATSPKAPAITRNDTITEYRLCNITVAPNANQITQANIEDTRPSSECGFVTNLLQDSDISATYAQWETQFSEWFNPIKDTLKNITAYVKLENLHTTTQDGETDIPIGIDKFQHSSDVLEVYISGLRVVKDKDYTLNGYESITLTLPVVSGTLIHFVVTKSIDGTNAESLLEDISNLNNRVTELEKPRKSDEPLWTGADILSGGEIVPSKKLSECNSGWLLLWSDNTNGKEGDYDYASTFVPKKKAEGQNWNRQTFMDIIPVSQATNGAYFTIVKKFFVYDDRIVGYEGNGVVQNGNACLRAIYEV